MKKWSIRRIKPFTAWESLYSINTWNTAGKQAYSWPIVLHHQTSRLIINRQTFYWYIKTISEILQKYQKNKEITWSDWHVGYCNCIHTVIVFKRVYFPAKGQQDFNLCCITFISLILHLAQYLFILGGPFISTKSRSHCNSNQEIKYEFLILLLKQQDYVRNIPIPPPRDKASVTSLSIYF
jgi:hypothetical protein